MGSWTEGSKGKLLGYLNTFDDKTNVLYKPPAVLDYCAQSETLIYIKTYTQKKEQVLNDDMKVCSVCTRQDLYLRVQLSAIADKQWAFAIRPRTEGT